MDRAPDTRPQVVLFDVFETMLELDALRPRFEAVGRPGSELELFFARTLRTGMALSLAGRARPFAEVAAAELRATSGHTLDDDAVAHVLAGFAELPAQPDAEPALRALADAGIPAYAFTHGSADVAGAALRHAGLTAYLRDVFSAETLATFKPPARAYHWACEQVGQRPENTALVAVHSWDTHGAVCAGLLAGFATRLEGALPAVVERPHVVASTVDGVVVGLLDLPG